MGRLGDATRPRSLVEKRASRSSYICWLVERVSRSRRPGLTGLMLFRISIGCRFLFFFSCNITGPVSSTLVCTSTIALFEPVAQHIRLVRLSIANFARATSIIVSISWVFHVPNTPLISSAMRYCRCWCRQPWWLLALRACGESATQAGPRGPRRTFSLALCSLALCGYLFAVFAILLIVWDIARLLSVAGRHPRMYIRLRGCLQSITLSNDTLSCSYL